LQGTDHLIGQFFLPERSREQRPLRKTTANRRSCETGPRRNSLCEQTRPAFLGACIQSRAKDLFRIANGPSLNRPRDRRRSHGETLRPPLWTERKTDERKVRHTIAAVSPIYLIAVLSTHISPRVNPVSAKW
jgi:hypothetical protein